MLEVPGSRCPHHAAVSEISGMTGFTRTAHGASRVVNVVPKLVGGIPTPLKNDGVSNSWDP